MRFFSNEFLPLLSVLPVIFIILLFLRKSREDAEYPFTKIFVSKKREKHHFKSFILKFLRIILVLSVLASAIFAIAKPYVKSDKTEILALFIDKTPYLKITPSSVNAMIDSLGGKKTYQRVHVYVNNSEIEYPIKEDYEFKSKLIEQGLISEFIARTLYSYKSYSVKSILLTDRNFKRVNGETDIMVIRNVPEVLITEIGGFIVLFSRYERVTELSFKLQNSLIKKMTVSLKKGFNRIINPVREFDFVSCIYDSVKIESGKAVSRIAVSDKTNNKFVTSVLNALDASNEENAEIGLAFNPGIKKGIVFSKKNKRRALKSEIFASDETIADYAYDMNKNLTYSFLYETEGEPLIMSKKGDVLLSKSKDVYFIALPLDTSISNFPLTPSFVLLIGHILRELSGGGENTANLDLDYRLQLTEPYSNFLQSFDPPKERDISFVFLFVSVILLIVLICT